jgi:Na+/H+-dicarboxylate symporter
MLKMERLGASKSVVGLVVPTGYSFNLDGTNIYMTLATLFLAQATNTPLTFGQEMEILVIAMITSKGASASPVRASSPSRRRSRSSRTSRSSRSRCCSASTSS